jgi:hypothetical protein
MRLTSVHTGRTSSLARNMHGCFRQSGNTHLIHNSTCLLDGSYPEIQGVLEFNSIGS